MYYIHALFIPLMDPIHFPDIGAEVDEKGMF